VATECRGAHVPRAAEAAPALEVRRARFGPGLRPGPYRQARWGGRGSGVNGAPWARPRAARMRSTVDAGGADPDNARRSVPGPRDFRPAIGAPGAMLMVETSSRLCGIGGVTAGTGCGRMPGQPCAAAAASVGLSSEGRERSCRPATARPRRSRPPAAGHPGRSTLPRLPALARVAGPGRQAWRAEGAPLKPWGKVSQTPHRTPLTSANVSRTAGLRTHLAQPGV